MARASRPLLKKTDPRHLSHAPPAVEYSYRVEMDKPIWPCFKDRKGSTYHRRISPQTFLGSAHLGIEHISTNAITIIESGRSRGMPLKGYDMKRAWLRMAQMPPSLPMQSGCLRVVICAPGKQSDTGTINTTVGAIAGTVVVSAKLSLDARAIVAVAKKTQLSIRRLSIRIARGGGERGVHTVSARREMSP